MMSRRCSPTRKSSGGKGGWDLLLKSSASASFDDECDVLVVQELERGRNLAEDDRKNILVGNEESESGSSMKCLTVPCTFISLTILDISSCSHSAISTFTSVFVFYSSSSTNQQLS